MLHNMVFDRNNYEIYMLDYLEGNLPEDIRNEFLVFLKRNPDLLIELEGVKDFRLEPESIHFQQKDLLKKDDIADIQGISKFELLSIACLEKDLLPQQKEQLGELLKNSPEKQKEFELFQKLKLEPDYKITFSNKNLIKKKSISIIQYRLIRTVAVAAGFILITGLILLLQKNSSRDYGKTLNTLVDNTFNPREANKINAVITENKGIKYINYQSNIILNDTIKRDELDIEFLPSKSLAYIDNESKGSSVVDIEEIMILQNQSLAVNSKDSSEIFDLWLKKRLDDLVPEKTDKKKISIASVKKNIGKFAQRIIGNQIKVDKKTLDDGSRLYAFKAGSIEIYTNIKPQKKSEDQQDNKYGKPNNPKD
ncbi:MAG: hypothetical protein U0W24_14900 [Bacteroidales bacterium]